ncbi:MAG: hypothetical protein V4692_07445 [Bdellovibrionota bacterium]
MNQMASAARTFAVIGLALISIALLTHKGIGVDVLMPWIVSLTVCLVSVLWLVWKPVITERGSAVIFLSIAASELLASSISASKFTNAQMPFTLFEAFKLVAVLIAALTPRPAWVGYLILSFCILVPPLQVLLLDPEIESWTNFREPWVTLQYAIAGILILRYRLNADGRQTVSVESQSSAKSKRDLAQVAEAVRDLTNTPLQSLEILSDLLKSNEIDSVQAADRMREATYRLREVVQIFEDNQTKLSMGQGSDTVDSFEVLRSKFTTGASRES